MPPKTWKLYTITNIWNGRVYVGVTGQADPLRRVEQHAKDETNAELYRDLRDAGTRCFHFRVVQTFAVEVEAYRAEQASVRMLVAHLGPYGLYNRREGGLPSFYGDRGLPPPQLRASLLKRIARGDGAISERTAALASRAAFRKQHCASPPPPTESAKQSRRETRKRRALRAKNRVDRRFAAVEVVRRK